MLKKLLIVLALVALTATAGFAQVSVEFRANMSVQISAGEFDATTGTLDVRGDFQGWSGDNAVLLEDSDSDQIYVGTLNSNDLAVGDSIQFKFVKNGDAWETIENRIHEIATASDVYEAYWDDNDGQAPTFPVVLAFRVDMELEILSGKFDPSADTLTVRGDFNGWSGDAIMEVDPGDANKFTLTDTADVELDQAVGYKFAYIANGATAWEDGDNSTIDMTQDVIDAGMYVVDRAFNYASIDDVTLNAMDVVFAVDMNNAMPRVGGEIDQNGFGTIENVAICGAQSPLAWPQGGWPTEDSTLVHFLNDSGNNGDATAGDGIWTTTLTFPPYTLLEFAYKYGANWGIYTNNGAVSNDNETDSGNDHVLTVEQNVFVQVRNDVFGYPDSTNVVGVEDEASDIVVDSYSLSQNYPNPFNPATTISFTLPEANKVTLKVYDILGQEVATLVNQELTQGQHTYNFNASQLTSGIYFYTISAGDFNMTRKMMLLK